MKVTDYFNHNKGKTFISFEILPPLKGGSMKEIFRNLDPLLEFKPPFIDVTYHREDYEYKITSSGHYEKVAIRKRPGTVGICAALMHRYGTDAVPHLICGGFTKADTENALIDLNFLGVNNVLCIRGDARRFDGKFIPTPNGNKFALDLVKQVGNLNNGQYQDDSVLGEKMDFCIGIAGYPEKHFEAANMDLDLMFTKQKVDAGADYIVTQMFFDNNKYFEYVERCHAIGINVPIIPGLKPLSKKYQIQSIPRIFHIDIPNELAFQIANEKNLESIKQIGIEWTIQQAKELKQKGVPCIHFYTMGDSQSIRKIVEAID